MIRFHSKHAEPSENVELANWSTKIYKAKRRWQNTAKQNAPAHEDSVLTTSSSERISPTLSIMKTLLDPHGEDKTKCNVKRK